MSKHTNKHWLREKEYNSLKTEYNCLYDMVPRYRWRLLPNTRVEEVNRKFLYKFYSEEYGVRGSAPKWFRKMLNKTQRAKSKQTLYKITHIEGDFVFEDNYKNAAWLYW